MVTEHHLWLRVFNFAGGAVGGLFVIGYVIVPFVFIFNGFPPSHGLATDVFNILINIVVAFISYQAVRLAFQNDKNSDGFKYWQGRELDRNVLNWIPILVGAVILVAAAWPVLFILAILRRTP